MTVKHIKILAIVEIVMGGASHCFLYVPITVFKHRIGGCSFGRRYTDLNSRKAN